uniref:Uncharacterized protein n=1 Tax=Physcomitrium patens TaxID=3218 RepID=A0A2K1KBE5_PHYPA|nr:hypothetical protein PHYPA_010280 [Physcomitrium patens]
MDDYPIFQFSISTALCNEAEHWPKYSTQWLLIFARHLQCACGMTIYTMSSLRHSSSGNKCKEIDFAVVVK